MSHCPNKKLMGSQTMKIPSRCRDISTLGAYLFYEFVVAPLNEYLVELGPVIKKQVLELSSLMAESIKGYCRK